MQAGEVADFGCEEFVSVPQVHLMAHHIVIRIVRP